MTVQEAIGNIKMILEEATSYEHAVCYVTSVDEEPLKLAIEALEKQIPKRPNRHEEEITDDYVSLEYYSCPVCKSNELADGYDFYCFRCGQKLDWGE